MAKELTELTEVTSLPDDAKFYAVDSTRDVLDQSVQIAKSNLISGGGAVDSVNGEVGVVVLDTSDIAEVTNLYYTDARVSANADVAANTLKVTDGKTTADIGTVIPLDSAIGHQCNILSANANTAYTLGTAVTGAVTRVLINTTVQPTITGATQEGGLEWVSGEDMYMVVFNAGTDAIPNVKYWFYFKAITTVTAPTINSIVTDEPTGSGVIPNTVYISQVDYDAAVIAGTTVATTLYVIN